MSTLAVLALLFVDNFEAAILACQAILRFGGLGHTCAIYATDDGKIREYAMRMPAFRVLANTPTPQGATGITTNVFPAMTLGCGAVAGNITSDNIGPLHLINLKRLAYYVRSAAEAFPAMSVPAESPIDRQKIVSAVERYLQNRGVVSAPAVVPAAPPQPSSVADLVDQALAAKRPQVARVVVAAAVVEAAPEPPAPVAVVAPLPIAEFVCEDDVRQAIRRDYKIYIGPKTIVTPSARELAGDILVLAQR